MPLYLQLELRKTRRTRAEIIDDHMAFFGMKIDAAANDTMMKQNF